MTDYHIAQINIATMLAPLESETMSGFVARLDEINGLAEGADGFVWRLKTDEDNATAIRAFDNDQIIINMSVWESIDALFDFTYQSNHVELFRQRRDWFSKMSKPFFAMWWIPAETVPTPEDAQAKLNHIAQHGITPLAFNFKQRYTVEEMLQATR